MAQFGASSSPWARPVAALNPGLSIGAISQPQLVTSLAPPLMATALSQPHMMTALSQPHMASPLGQPHVVAAAAAALGQPHHMVVGALGHQPTLSTSSALAAASSVLAAAAALNQPPHHMVASQLGHPPPTLPALSTSPALAAASSVLAAVAASQPQLATTVASLLSPAGGSVAASPSFYSPLAVASAPSGQASTYHTQLAAAAAAAAAAAHTQYQNQQQQQQLAAQVSYQLAIAAAATGTPAGTVTQFGAHHQIAATSVGQPSVALPATFAPSVVGAVSFPAMTRVTTQLGTVIGTSAAAAQIHAQQHAALQTQRAFIGTVTKIGDAFGLVDDEVFFRTTVCMGGMPKLNDRVLVEATFDSAMPVKWNATRVQLFPNQPALQQQAVLQQQHHAQTAMAAAAAAAATHIQPLMPIQQSVAPATVTVSSLVPPGMISRFVPISNAPCPVATGGSLLPSSSSSRTMADMSKPRVEREKERQRQLTRDREARRSPGRRQSSLSPAPLRSRGAAGGAQSPPKRATSPRHGGRSPSASPHRRRLRNMPRYSVHIPKVTFDRKSLSVIDVWSRYPNLYIPSDFLSLTNHWTDAFPIQSPCRLDQPVRFHVLSKDVDVQGPSSATLDAADANHLFSAKVMLLAPPSMEDLYRKSCPGVSDIDTTPRHRAGSGADEDGGDSCAAPQHPARLLNFLVGLRGSRAEPLAIGGAWSPSLDGADPAGDPAVLVRTAIRTTRALTGVDLSCCTQWYRFTEIRYQRTEEMHRGKLVPAHVETVVIFLPDVWNCMPTLLDWHSTLAAAHKKHLQTAGRPGSSQPPVTAAAHEDDYSHVQDAGGSSRCHGDEGACRADLCSVEKQTDERPLLDSRCRSANGEGLTTQPEEARVGTCDQPSQHAADAADPKILKVGDLKKQLEVRGLSSKGLKVQLVARLSKSIKAESVREASAVAVEEEDGGDAGAAGSLPQGELSKKADVGFSQTNADSAAAPERANAEDHVAEQAEKSCVAPDTLPGMQHILVQPRRSAKGGKFDCALMSLSVLLDYRPEDKKEHSFEISLFAEAFNEMLMRDFGFVIYKRLLYASTLVPDEENKMDEGYRSNDRYWRSDDESSRKRRKTEDDSDTDDSGCRLMEVEADEKKKGASCLRSGEHRRPQPAAEVDKDTLLAFSYFDAGHAGFLMERDVEDILHTLGLQLSRAQVRKIVQASASRDCLNYKKVAEKCYGYTDEALPSNGLTYVKAKQSQAPGLDNLLPALAAGGAVSTADPQRAAVLKDGSGRTDCDLLPYKGSLLDVQSLFGRLSKSEVARSALEHKLRSVLAELDHTRDMLGKSDDTCEALAVKLNRTSTRLESLTRVNESVEASSRQCHDALSRSKTSLQQLLTDIESALASAAAPQAGGTA